MVRYCKILVGIFIFVCMHAQSDAGTTPSLYNSFAGYVDFVVTGGTLRTESNSGDSSAVTDNDSASLSGIPSGSIIRAAYLYWAGSCSNFTTSPDYDITFEGISIAADREFEETFTYTGNDYNFFSGFEDVTDVVRAKTDPNDTYNIADLDVYNGTPHSAVAAVVGGWTLIVVYESTATVNQLHVVNVYDGFEFYREKSILIKPSNFEIPVSNIDGKCGHITWEGDYENSDELNGYTEKLQFGIGDLPRGSGSLNELTGCCNPTDNQFNSASNVLDDCSPICLGDEGMSYGVDIDLYDISSYLTAGTTIVTTNYESGGDLVLLSAEVISVSNVDVADLAISKSRSGSFTPGGTGTYTIIVSNNGPSEEQNIVTVADTLPAELTYISSPDTGWSVSDSGQDITWTYDCSVDPLASGDTLPAITLIVDIDSGASGTISNTATVSSATFDNIFSNDSSTDDSTVADISATKTSDAAGNLVEAGDTITYTIDVTNNSSITNNNIVVNDPLPANTTYVPSSTQITAPKRNVRVKEYYINDFLGTTYDLTLSNDLLEDYFVIIQGSDGDGSDANNRGPDENYAALTADPFGTGELAVSSGNNIITLTRGNNEDSWVGVVTVVESLDSGGDGFDLLDVRRVTHPAGSGAASTAGSAASGTSWSDINQVMLMGGFNGAGCNTTQANVANTYTCHVRIYPSGTNTIQWTRDSTVGAHSDVTSTIMVVEWGTNWTVQGIRVQGNNGGDGANATGEYNTGSISSVTRANTWVWGTGHTSVEGIGETAEGVLITLGDGVNQNVNESLVAVGQEYASTLDFEVYALTHPDLLVDYRFKADGDSGSLTVDVTVDTAKNCMALSYNGCNGQGTAYPRPMFSARYFNDSTVRLERRRWNQDFPAWVQGIDFSQVSEVSTFTGGTPPDLATVDDGYYLPSGDSMSITFQVTVDDPLGSAVTEITNTASVDSDEITSPAAPTVTDYVPHFDSYRSDYSTSEEIYNLDPEGTGKGDETIYTGGEAYVPGGAYDVAYYDSTDTLVDTDTTASGDFSGFLKSSYAPSAPVNYNTWTAVVMTDGTTANSNLSTQLADSSTIISDTFDVATWSTVEFTDATGASAASYSVGAGGGEAFIKVVDNDKNTDPLVAECITVTVSVDLSGTVSDSETVTLCETGPDTGEFGNFGVGSGLDLSLICAAVTDEDGVLCLDGDADSTINVGYTDGDDTTDSDSDAITATPTLVVLSSFGAYEQDGQVTVVWETASEIGTLGFFLKRKDPVTGKYVKLNKKLLPGMMVSHQGGIYRYIDQGVLPGETCSYKLVELEVKGIKRTYGPFTVTVGEPGIDFDDNNQFAPMKKTSTVFDMHGFSRKARPMPIAKRARLKSRFVAKDLKTEDTGETYTQNRLHRFKKRQWGWYRDRNTLAKIRVTKSGLYYIGSDEIGDRLEIDNAKVRNLIRKGGLKLTCQGEPVAYQAMDQNSGICFYGQSSDSVYTNENCYWLKQGIGLKMADTDGSALVSANEPVSSVEMIHVEENRYALTAMFDDPEEDFWLWDYVVAGYPGLESKTVSFMVDDPAESDEQASMTIHLLGATDTDARPDHHVIVKLNNTQIGEGYWDGDEPISQEYTFDRALIVDGENILEIVGVLDSGVPYSIFYIDSFDLTFHRYFHAIDNKLAFNGLEPGAVMTVSDFTGPDIIVADITEPFRPVVVTGTLVEGGPDSYQPGSYQVSFKSTSSNARYMAITKSALSAPDAFTTAVSSNLKRRRNRADYLVITPTALRIAADSLADYRQGTGFDTKVVELEAVVDTFNQGVFSPEAIKDFLTYAYGNWRKPPRYVVLVGNGTYDYKDYMGHGDNLMPPIIVKTPDGIFASDNRLADINDDGVPEMAVGRLPVLTAEELENLIDKIKAYEEDGYGSWTKKVMMLADDPDVGGNFPADSDDVGALIPHDFDTQYIYLYEHSLEDVRQLVLDGLNEGALLMNYIGHGAMDRFSQEGILLTTDVPLLINDHRLPVVATMTCVVGRFEIPGYDSLSEALLLHKDGGAAAVWAPTGLSLNSYAKYLDEAFFREIFVNGENTLGDAILNAFIEYNAYKEKTYIIDIYNLLGDPGLQVW